jgi:hypothetical protein
LRVRDGSRLRRHFAARVGVGSNVAESLDVHAQEECNTERWRRHVTGRSWRLDGCTCGNETVVTSQDSDGSGSDSGGRKMKGEWGQPHPGPPYLYGVSTKSAHCGSFRRTTCLNGSIPRSSREV